MFMQGEGAYYGIDENGFGKCSLKELYNQIKGLSNTMWKNKLKIAEKKWKRKIFHLVNLF